MPLFESWPHPVLLGCIQWVIEVFSLKEKNDISFLFWLLDLRNRNSTFFFFFNIKKRGILIVFALGWPPNGIFVDLSINFPRKHRQGKMGVAQRRVRRAMSLPSCRCRVYFFFFFLISWYAPTCAESVRIGWNRWNRQIQAVPALNWQIQAKIQKEKKKKR